MSGNGRGLYQSMPTEEYMKAIYGDAYDAVSEPKFRITDWGMERYMGSAPPIDWLIEGVLPRATPGLVASIGGVGKSYLLLDLCVRIAAGPGSGYGAQFALGGKIKSQGKAIMLTAEESQSAVHRRLDQIVLPALKEQLQDQLYVVPIPDTGGNVTFLTSSRGEYRMSPAWRDVCDEVNSIEGVDLVVMDPLQVFAAADINSDPAAAQTFWSSVSVLCASSGASVLVAHHMRKDDHIDGPFSARAAIRGTSALCDGARAVFAIWLASDEERATASQALDYVIGPMEMAHGCIVKSNDIGMGEPRTFLRDQETGLLNDRTEELMDEIAEAQTITETQRIQIFDEVSKRWEQERPFSPSPQAGGRYLGRWMMEQYRISKQSARAYIQEWRDDGFLVYNKNESSGGLRGLRVG